MSGDLYDPFMGRFQFKLDQRGHLRIPVSWRRVLGNEPLIILPRPVHLAGATANCLVAWPEPVFFQRRLEVAATSERSAEAVAAEAWLLAGTPVVHRPDARGRLKLPVNQLEAAGLAAGAVVLLAGVLDRFELWKPEAWQTRGIAHAAAAAAWLRII